MTTASLPQPWQDGKMCVGHGRLRLRQHSGPVTCLPSRTQVKAVCASSFLSLELCPLSVATDGLSLPEINQ